MCFSMTNHCRCSSHSLSFTYMKKKLIRSNFSFNLFLEQKANSVNGFAIRFSRALLFLNNFPHICKKTTNHVKMSFSPPVDLIFFIHPLSSALFLSSSHCVSLSFLLFLLETAARIRKRTENTFFIFAFLRF